jgi:hypothetical protein
MFCPEQPTPAASRAALTASRGLWPRVGARLRLDLLCKQGRGEATPLPSLRTPHSVICPATPLPTFVIHFSTFAQAFGRFAPLHCLPSPPPTLHTLANQSPLFALPYSVLCNLYSDFNSPFHPLHRSSAPISTFAPAPTPLSPCLPPPIPPISPPILYVHHTPYYPRRLGRKPQR